MREHFFFHYFPADLNSVGLDDREREYLLDSYDSWRRKPSLAQKWKSILGGGCQDCNVRKCVMHEKAETGSCCSCLIFMDEHSVWSDDQELTIIYFAK
jgi:hypothetical protein